MTCDHHSPTMINIILALHIVAQIENTKHKIQNAKCKKAAYRTQKGKIQNRNTQYEIQVMNYEYYSHPVTTAPDAKISNTKYS